MFVFAASALFLLAAAPQSNPIPAPSAPAENPITPEKAVLGKILFWEEQLSSDDTMACGTCHMPSAGYADPRFGVHPGTDQVLGTADDTFTSPGIIRQDAFENYSPDPLFRLRRQLTRRRTPDVFSALYTSSSFWDGRGLDTFTNPVTGLVSIPVEASLESQVAGPPLANAEMAHESRDWTDVVAKISGVQPLSLATDLPLDIAATLTIFGDYPALFEWAFGSPGITAERIIFAIATYERTLVPDLAPWALWTAGLPNNMTQDQIEGWVQFNSIAECHTCHPPPIFTDDTYHNIGLRPIAEDNGRLGITGLYADRGKFKTPSLLSAGLRPRFFHTGEETELFTTSPPPQPGAPPVIGGVAGLYMTGGGPNLDNLDPLLTQLSTVPGLEMDKVMDFVGSALTDPRMAAEVYPFDRPMLRSERVPVESNFFGQPTAGQPGAEPLRLIAMVPAHVGSDVFKVGLQGGPAGATALVGVSWQAGNGSTQIGAAIWIGRLLQPLTPVVLQDDGCGVGYATLRAAIPQRPALAGRTLHVQAFLSDPLAPTGVCATRAAELKIL